MKKLDKKLEIASYLNGVWHDPIKETPKKDGALCIVSVGVDEDEKDTYDLFLWDEKMKAFDTGIGHYANEDLKDKHAWICPEGCTRWCYLEDLLPEPKQTGECTEIDPAKLDKRFWLRSNLLRVYGNPYDKTNIEEAFLWIYDAPLKKWENMIKALELSRDLGGDPGNLGLLKRGKELYDFLS